MHSIAPLYVDNTRRVKGRPAVFGAAVESGTLDVEQAGDISSAFTAGSILIRGGQGLLNPSPGSLRVASMPILVPTANSVVA